MDWLDSRIEKKAAKPDKYWNNHWNNHVRFCRIVEPYMTLCYTIKNGNMGLLRYALKKLCIIFQTPVACKPKYARTMLRQVHIFDTKVANPIFQKAYLANALINLKEERRTFYKMDLLLEHQNRDFKYFLANCRSSLQESDEMF